MNCFYTPLIDRVLTSLFPWCAPYVGACFAIVPMCWQSPSCAQTNDSLAWTLPAVPQYVLTLPHDALPPSIASGAFQYLAIDPSFNQDKWVIAMELLWAEVDPSRRPICEVTVFVRPPDAVSRSDVQRLMCASPTTAAKVFPPGAAVRIPAGSQLVFRLLSNAQPADGAATAAIPFATLGCVFAERDNIREQVHSLEILYAPDSETLAAVGRTPFASGSRLFGFAADSGEAVRVELVTPKESKILLDGANHQTQWPIDHRFDPPISLEGAHITCQRTQPASAIESARVPLQRPKPLEQVGVYLDVAVPLTTETLTAGIQPGVSSVDREAKARQIAEKFFQILDEDRDGLLTPAETPESYRVFSFRQADTNQDNFLTWTEILQQARLSLRP